LVLEKHLFSERHSVLNPNQLTTISQGQISIAEGHVRFFAILQRQSFQKEKMGCFIVARCSKADVKNVPDSAPFHHDVQNCIQILHQSYMLDKSNCKYFII